MGEKAVNFEAWAKSAVGYIKARKLESDFSDWCGGWKPPFGTEPCDPDPAATMKEVREVLGKLAAVKIERAVPEVEATDPWPGSRVLFGYDGWELTVGDVRHARALLAKLEVANG